jgi:radical SAM protein with 4Fe4S-binding SPASM domain
VEKLQVHSVAVELTARCNQSCSYCYNAWREDGGKELGELSSEKLQSMLRKLFAEADVEHITLTGGEPFLRNDIFELISLINQQNISASLISNGGLITQEKAEKLATYEVSHVQLSFAGATAEVHDLVCGTHSFQKCIEATQHLAKAGIEVFGSFICSKKSWMQTEQVLRLMHSLGIRHVAFNRFNPSGYGIGATKSLLPTRSEVVSALGAAQTVAAELGLDITCTMPIPPCVFDEDDYPNIAFGSCSAGTLEGEIALGPEGNLKLCTLQKNPVGNFHQMSLAQMISTGAFEDFRKKIPSFCEGCPHAESCLGGCGASAEWLFGDAGELDPFVAQHVMPDLWRSIRGKS